MLADYLEDFVRVVRAARPDGLGGVVEEWRDGEGFRGGVTDVPGSEIDVAGQRMLRAHPVLVHETSVGFQQGERVRRVADGAVFRVAGLDRVTPEKAWVKFGQVVVERV